MYIDLHYSFHLHALGRYQVLFFKFIKSFIGYTPVALISSDLEN